VKSYRQYCALARGLDVIGDRWVLLIVRELLGGSRRYTDLAYGLPGVATNVLAERLRTMHDAGLVAKTDDDRYRLTDWGERLGDVVAAIGRWATPLMGRLDDDDTFRGHWIAFPIAALFPDVNPTRPDVSIEVRCGDQPMTIQSSAGRVAVQAGHSAAPDLVLTGPPDATVALLGRQIDAREAKAQGVSITGDARLLRRLRPAMPSTR
jgi:DNA-binding HxlR family transcriptional regulator